MTVYLNNPGDKTYSYDFQLGGKRYKGDTGKTSKREAEREEKRLRAQARLEAQQRLEAQRQFKGGEMAFETAAARYMDEKGQHLVAAGDELRYMEWLSLNLGSATLLSAIDGAAVARLVGIRRAEFRRNGSPPKTDRARAKAKPPRLVTPAEVNRSVIAPLRRVLIHASNPEGWAVRVVPISWKKYRLKESGHIVREANQGEQRRIEAELAEGKDVAIRFAFLTGCRRAEIVSLSWADVDFELGQLRVTGKGDKSRTLPMTGEVRQLLEAQRGYHDHWVFTFVAQRTITKNPTSGRSYVKGQRYPLVASGLKTAMQRGTIKSRVPDFRMHDTRHTAATRALRATGNLAAVQDMLGHSDPATTRRYAHVMIDDIRQAMEGAARFAPAPFSSSGASAAESPLKSPLKLIRRTAK